MIHQVACSDVHLSDVNQNLDPSSETAYDCYLLTLCLMRSYAKTGQNFDLKTGPMIKPLYL